MCRNHFAEAFNESAAKGKQMVIGGTKSKTASQSGYFDATFNRILQVFMFTNFHLYHGYMYMYV